MCPLVLVCVFLRSAQLASWFTVEGACGTPSTFQPLMITKVVRHVALGAPQDACRATRTCTHLRRYEHPFEEMFGFGSDGFAAFIGLLVAQIPTGVHRIHEGTQCVHGA